MSGRLVVIGLFVTAAALLGGGALIWRAMFDPRVHAASVDEVAAQIDFDTLAGESGELRQALSELRAHSLNIERWGNLGRQLEQLGQEAAAIRAYGQAAELSPSELRWPYFVGVLRERRGEVDGALAAYDRAIALQESYCPLYIRAGRLRLARGQHQAAIRHALMARSDSDNGAAALAVLVRATTATLEFASAESYLDELAALDEPSAKLVTALRAELCRARGDGDCGDAAVDVDTPLVDPLRDR